MSVMSDPVAGREGEYDSWYNERHLQDLLAVPGFKGARRYLVLDAFSHGAARRFVAQYELETDNLPATMAVVNQRLGTPAMPMSETFDGATAVVIVSEAITERLTG